MTEQIKDLRKSGKLRDAYFLAEKLLKENPGNSDITLEMAWVMYAYLAEAIEKKTPHGILDLINKAKEYLPEEPHIIHECFAWKIIKYCFKLIKSGKMCSDKLIELIQIMNDLIYPRPSEIHSAFLNAVILSRVPEFDWVEFVKKWSWINLREDDFKETGQNGNLYPSLAMKLITPICKQIFGLSNSETNLYNERIMDIIKQLGIIQFKLTGFSFLPYYITKLKILTGCRESLLPGFITFAREKSNEFWVWHLMSSFPEFSEEEKLASCSRALLCTVKDGFLVKVRLRLISFLLSKKLLTQAVAELERVIKTYNHNGWKFGSDILELMQQDWFTTSQNKKVSDYSKMYFSHLAVANNLLFNNVRIIPCLVNGIDHKHRVVYYSVSKESAGSFRWPFTSELPAIGVCLGIRLAEQAEGSDRRNFVLSIENTTEKPSPSIYKELIGELIIKPGNPFGFVRDCYVPEQLIEKENLKPGQMVFVSAGASFNKKKDQWGWKVIKLEKHKATG